MTKIKKGDKVIFLSPYAPKEHPYKERIYTVISMKKYLGDIRIFTKETAAKDTLFLSEKPILASKLVKKLYGKRK